MRPQNTGWRWDPFPSEFPNENATAVRASQISEGLTDHHQWSTSSSKPWGCCSRFPAVPDIREPGRHSHKHKNMGAPPLSVSLTFYSSLSTWSRRWPFSSLYSRAIQLSPRHGEGRISSGYPRDMGSIWCTPIFLGHTDLDLPRRWNSWARGSHPAAGEAMEEQGTLSTIKLEYLINIWNYC